MARLTKQLVILIIFSCTFQGTESKPKNRNKEPAKFIGDIKSGIEATIKRHNDGDTKNILNRSKGSNSYSKSANNPAVFTIDLVPSINTVSVETGEHDAISVASPNKNINSGSQSRNSVSHRDTSHEKNSDSGLQRGSSQRSNSKSGSQRDTNPGGNSNNGSHKDNNQGSSRDNQSQQSSKSQKKNSGRNGNGSKHSAGDIKDTEAFPINFGRQTDEDGSSSDDKQVADDNWHGNEETLTLVVGDDSGNKDRTSRDRDDGSRTSQDESNNSGSQNGVSINLSKGRGSKGSQIQNSNLGWLSQSVVSKSNNQVSGSQSKRSNIGSNGGRSSKYSTIRGSRSRNIVDSSKSKSSYKESNGRSLGKYSARTGSESDNSVDYNYNESKSSNKASSRSRSSVIASRGSESENAKGSSEDKSSYKGSNGKSHNTFSASKGSKSENVEDNGDVKSSNKSSNSRSRSSSRVSRGSKGEDSVDRSKGKSSYKWSKGMSQSRFSASKGSKSDNSVYNSEGKSSNKASNTRSRNSIIVIRGSKSENVGDNSEGKSSYTGLNSRSRSSYSASRSSKSENIELSIESKSSNKVSNRESRSSYSASRGSKSELLEPSNENKSSNKGSNRESRSSYSASRGSKSENVEPSSESIISNKRSDRESRSSYSSEIRSFNQEAKSKSSGGSYSSEGSREVYEDWLQKKIENEEENTINDIIGGDREVDLPSADQDAPIFDGPIGDDRLGDIIGNDQELEAPENWLPILDDRLPMLPEEPATTTEPPTTTAQAPLPLGCTAASDCGENANCDEGACVCNPGFGGDPKVSCKEYCTCEFLGDPLLSTFEGILEMVAGDFSFFDIGVCGLSSRVFLALQGDQLYPVKLTIRFRDLDITIWKNKTVEYQDSSSTLPDTVTLTDTPQVIPTHPDVKLSLENGYALVDITCNGEPVQVGFDPEGAKTRGVVVVPQSLADSIGQDPDSECGQCSGGNKT